MLRRALTTLAQTLTLALLPVATAQDGGDTPAMTKALAAGYKAGFICSATFTADQSLREIELNELTGIYPDMREAFAALPGAKIDERARTVSVRYDPDMPPRIAAWREGLGCTQLPVGAGPEAVAFLPRFESWTPPDGRDGSPTLSPTGEKDAISLSSYSTFDAPVDFAFDGHTYGEGTKTSAVLVVYRGDILAEDYARGINATTPQRTWSVAKSLTATLIGAAVERGVLDIDHEAVLPEWSGGGDPRRAITLRHLLNMASGRDSGVSGARTDRLYFGGARVADTAITASLEAAPGTRFNYANNDTLAALRVLRGKLADDGAYLRFPYEAVLWKIGMNNTVLETDWAGDFVGSSQVWTTARDLARLGLLYLYDGMWGQERILPQGWRDFVTSPAPAQPAAGDFGYGAQFWLLNRSPGVPEDAFAAIGNRGQYVVIIPSKELVIVRRGYDDIGGARFDIARFTADLVGALDAAIAARQAEDAAALAEALALEEPAPADAGQP